MTVLGATFWGLGSQNQFLAFWDPGKPYTQRTGSIAPVPEGLSHCPHSPAHTVSVGSMFSACLAVSVWGERSSKHLWLSGLQF